MKKVLIFGIKTFPSKGGTDRVAENIIKELSDEFHFTLYYLEGTLSEEHRYENIKLVRFPFNYKNSISVFLYFLVSSIYSLFSRYDLVHVHKIESAIFIPIIRIRNKVVATSHESAYLRDKWNFYQKLYFRIAERFYIYAPNINTCISKSLTEFYKKKYSKNVVFIPNGVNLIPSDRFDIKAATAILPDKISLSDKYLLYSSRRLMSTKGCHTFLQALKKIQYSGNVIILGELDKRSPYLHRLKKISEGLNVYFLGFLHPIESLLALVSKCQLFVFPSETEGMSIMLLEVASVGSPIIASDIPENTQVFGNEEVLYFTSKDSDDLAEKISYALQHPVEMQKLGINARSRVYSDYQWPKVAEQYAQVYDSLLKN